MDSKDSSENEEAGGSRGTYRRDSRDSEHDSDSDNRAGEGDVQGSEADESEEDQITNVGCLTAQFPIIADGL